MPSISADPEEEESKVGTPEHATLALLEFERPVVAVPGCKGKRYAVSLILCEKYLEMLEIVF